MLMNHNVSQALQWRLSAALRETSDQGERLTLTFLWVKLTQGWAGREKKQTSSVCLDSSRFPASSRRHSRRQRGVWRGGCRRSRERCVSQLIPRPSCLTFAHLFILHVCKQQNSFWLNLLQWCSLVWNLAWSYMPRDNDCFSAAPPA